MILFVLSAFVVRIVALSPNFLLFNFDYSMRFATNYAVAHGLVFGKDIIFTYGPYASVMSMDYSPYTDHLMLLGGILLSFSYAALLIGVSRKSSPFWLLIISVVILGFNISQDSLFLFFPLLLSTFVYRVCLPRDHSLHIPRSAMAGITIASSFIVLGLLLLIKTSFIPVILCLGSLCIGVLWYAKMRRLALMNFVTIILSIVALWLFAGQPLGGLPQYFMTSVYMFSGYAEAMSLKGDAVQIYLYILSCLSICFVIFFVNKAPFFQRIFLLISFVIFLSALFKVSYIRHDQPHFIAGSSAILLVGLTLWLIVKSRYFTLLGVLLLITWFYSENMLASPASIASIYSTVAYGYSRSFEGLANRMNCKDCLQHDFALVSKGIGRSCPVPKFSGTTDTHSVAQAFLLVTGNVWSPRPVFQSYAAYNPTLAGLNASHLIGPRAPDTILFTLEPIDYRYPTLEEGLSMIYLIHNYSVDHMDKCFAYLKKSSPEGAIPQKNVLSTGNHVFGTSVSVPLTNSLIYAELDIEQTIPGKILSMLYKPPELHIKADLADGSTKMYRMISGMGKSGFIISPLIENTGEFTYLFGDSGQLNSKRVKSFVVFSDDPGAYFWNQNYGVRLSSFTLTDHPSILGTDAGANK